MVTPLASQRFRDQLTVADAKGFTTRSDGRAGLMLLNNWALIALAFALPALWLNPLTVIVSLMLLGNRQLGLAILMHECAHNTFFTSRRLNRLLGHWLCGAPLMVQIDGYRSYHLRALHRYLLARGLLDHVAVPEGYGQVVRALTRSDIATA